MYSSRIIARNIETYLSRNPQQKLNRVSRLEFSRAVAHLDSLVLHDPESGRLIPTRRVTPDGRQVFNDATGAPLLHWQETITDEERSFIKQQRILCAMDFWYWVERAVWIKDTDNRTVRMELWKSQEIFLKLIAEMEDEEIALFVIILKARQLGISRIVSLILLHRVVFDSNINAYLASSTEKKTLKLFKLISFVLVRMPFWMQPGSGQPGKLGKVDQAGKLLEFFNGSAITMEHGQQSTGMARGDSPNVVHLCLSGRTLVRTADSRLTPINEVKDGDTVINSDGEQRRVRRAFKSPRTSEMTSEIRVWGSPTVLSCTRDHRVLTQYGWAQAKDVKAGDWIQYPIRPIREDLDLMIRVYRKGQHLDGPNAPQPTKHECTFEIGRLVGLYLAEGSIVRSQHGRSANRYPTHLVFSVHSDEEDRTRLWMDEAFSGFGYRKATNRKNSKSCVVPMAHKGFAVWLSENFGEKDDKRVSDLCWRLGRDFAEGVVHGYLAGDGHFSPKNNEIYASSIREAIPFGIRELLVSLGYGWSQISYREAGLWYGRNCASSWTLVLAGQTAYRYRFENNITTHNVPERMHHWRIEDGKLLLEVHSNGSGWSESFYDVEVDCPLHNFLTSCGICHNSELAEFDDLTSLVDSALLRGMHPSPRAFLALEGTAEGINNAWHQKWETAKSDWPRRKGRLRPLFLPWFVGGLYPKEVDLRSRPVPLDYPTSMAPWALTHAKMAEEYVRQTDYLSRHLGSNWKMPIEQIWYYECERDSAIKENRLNKFLQEMPANDDEAFQSSNVTVFDVETINYYRTQTHMQPVWGVFGLRGPTEFIPPRLQPADILIDHSKPVIPIMADAGGGITIPFELVPIRFDGWSLEGDSSRGSIDKIYVWEPPLEGFEYGFGCDTASGVDQDRTCIQGLRKYSLEGPTKQVLEFSSGHMNALDAWPFLLALGTWYSVRGRHGEVQQPRMAIECKGHGDLVQNVLRMMNWHNFHMWNDRKIDDKKVDLSKVHKMGVFTNQFFRRSMIEMIVRSLRDGEIEICSPFFVKEMQSLEGDELDQDLRAGYGGHDDRIMAVGFILSSFYKWDPNYWRAAKVMAYSGRNPAQVMQGDSLLLGNSEAPKPVSSRQYAQWCYGDQTRTDGGL